MLTKDIDRAVALARSVLANKYMITLVEQDLASIVDEMFTHIRELEAAHDTQRRELQARNTELVMQNRKMEGALNAVATGAAGSIINYLHLRKLNVSSYFDECAILAARFAIDPATKDPE
jgi:hypothetical protein